MRPSIAYGAGRTVEEPSYHRDRGSGKGGPVHIEGTVYSVAESHIHKSEPYQSSYAVGSEIAESRSAWVPGLMTNPFRSK